MWQRTTGEKTHSHVHVSWTCRARLAPRKRLIASINKNYEAVAADVFFDWKHSRQNTGRPCVGLKGTVVSFSHPEQIAFVSTLLYPAAGRPSACARFPLHALQRFGSFLNCLSWKKSCSPAVKTKSSPQSTHFRVLSWNSIGVLPLSARVPRPRNSPSRLPLKNRSEIYLQIQERLVSRSTSCSTLHAMGADYKCV